MRRRPVREAAAILALVLATATPGASQERLSLSHSGFARSLREWFPERLPIAEGSVEIGRLWCLDSDITRFSATVTTAPSVAGPVVSITGSVRLDPLPENLRVLGGAFGEWYTLLLQGYVLSPRREILWSAHGHPEGGGRVPRLGALVSFHLEGPATGDVSGATAVIVAIGEPVAVGAGGPDRVILGMTSLPIP